MICDTSEIVTKMCDRLFPDFEFPKLALVSFLITVTDFNFANIYLLLSGNLQLFMTFTFYGPETIVITLKASLYYWLCVGWCFQKHKLSLFQLGTLSIRSFWFDKWQSWERITRTSNAIFKDFLLGPFRVPKGNWPSK